MVWKKDGRNDLVRGRDGNHGTPVNICSAIAMVPSSVEVFIIHTHLSALEFASSESNSNVVELIPPAASRADAKNNIFMVTTSPSPEADDDMTLSCINQK